MPTKPTKPTEEPYAHFLAISPEKQQRVIEAALEEFADSDYASASTNAIVRRAGISKGLLFHYFGDKEGLYQYLLDHIAREHYATLETSIDPGRDDFFDIMRKGAEAKLEVMTRDLLATRLYMRAMTDRALPSRVRKSLDRTVAEAYDVFEAMAALIDEGRLRKGLDKGMVVNTIRWASEGLVNQLLATVEPQVQSAEFSQMMEYTLGYFDFLRCLFYEDPPLTQTPGLLPTSERQAT
jgi:AcrR family transcriptional regulator